MVDSNNVRGQNRHPITPHNRAVGPLLLGAVALVTLLASSAYPQILEDTIVLPDTFGPLPGPLHMAYDDDWGHARLYIGGEADHGGVLVVNPLTCEKLARIATGPVSDVAVNVPRGKLYVARKDADSLLVVDCESHRIVGEIPLPGLPSALLYNHVNDRLYVVGTEIVVIDCAGDTIVRVLAPSPAPATDVVLALDPMRNKLYVGATQLTYVVDCNSGSIIDTLPGLRGPAAMVFNPVVSKLYVTAADTLFVVATANDSVCARFYFEWLRPLLACDPVHGRTYCADGPWFTAVDCAGDTLIYSRWAYPPPTALECDPVSDRIYYREGEALHLFHAAPLEYDTMLVVEGSWSCCLQRLDRLGYMVALLDTGASRVFDCRTDSSVGTVPTMGRPGCVCVGATGAKLYMTGGLDITVVDCSLNIVTSHIQGQHVPGAMSYSPAENRLYVACSDAFVSVYDCTSDTLLKRIPLTERKRVILSHPGLSKLYLYDGRGVQVAETLVVIECGPDTVRRLIPLPRDDRQQVFLVPGLSQLWCLGGGHLIMIDCLGDSIIVDTLVNWGTTTNACVSVEDRKVYAARYADSLRVIHMDSLSQVTTIAGPGTGSRSPLVYVPLAHKVYWFTDPGLWVIDSRTDSVTARLGCDFGIVDARLDRTGTYLYCLSEWDSLLYVMDTHDDSVISQTPQPLPIWDSLVMNEWNHRMYFEGWGAAKVGMPVIRDSIVKPGVTEYTMQPTTRRGPPTVIRRNARLRYVSTGTIFDATGRRAAALRPGLNDISHLTPGVYFIREEPQAAGLKPQAVRKVVVVR